MLTNVKAVIFDLDGTLVDSMWMWRDIDIEFLGTRNIELPNNLQKDIEGMSFSETAVYFKETFQLEESLDEIKLIWNQMARDKYANQVPLKEGALDFLKYLKEKQIKIGIATSNSRELVSIVLDSLQINDLFDLVVTACDVNAGKPNPDIYLKVAKDFNVLVDECLVFEDVPMGILAGKNANMKVCAIEDEFSMHMKSEKEELADYYITSYNDLFMEH